MGWFWGGSSNKDDPVKKLDPELRAYLEQQAPAKYVPAAPIQPSPEPSKPSESTKSAPQPSSSEAAESSQPKVPAASLFPDGRYAHLWKTYKPLHEVEASPVAGAERVIDKYKQRKDLVHRAAMENCALEHEALTFCFKRGTWRDQLKARATMCSEENSKFSRCYTTQAVSYIYPFFFLTLIYPLRCIY